MLDVNSYSEILYHFIFRRCSFSVGSVKVVSLLVLSLGMTCACNTLASNRLPFCADEAKQLLGSGIIVMNHFQHIALPSWARGIPVHIRRRDYRVIAHKSSVDLILEHLTI